MAVNPFQTSAFNPYISMEPSARVTIPGVGKTTVASDMAKLWAATGGGSSSIQQEYDSGMYALGPDLQSTYQQPSVAPTPAPSSSGGGGGGRSRATNILQSVAARPKTEAEIRAEQLARATKAQASARGYGLDKLTGDFTYHGFNPDDYSTQIDRFLTGIGETIDPYDENAKQYYTGDIFGQLKGNIEAEDVGRYQNELDQFLGSGWENSYVDDSLGESTINSILGQQYGDATGAIDRAYKRGTLTDTGQQYSLGQLGQQYNAGYSIMDDLRDGIVSGYRNDLVEQGNNAYNQLNTYSLGDTFNSGDVQSNIGDFYKNQKAGFGGNFRADFGDQQLFDWNSLIQKGGINQGVTNQAKSSPDVLAALSNRQVDEEDRRGLGSQGVF
jgi:hypothetical protein